MSITAIPTRYGGVLFKSRLEAKWAAFFDVLGWEWEYEPRRYGGWLPDFELKGAIKVLVEVKPIDDFSSVFANRMAEAMWDDSKDGNWPDVLLVGKSPNLFDPEFFMGESLLGWLGENGGIGPLSERDHWWTNFSPAPLWKIWKQSRVGFFHQNFSWRDRISGVYDGDHYLEEPIPAAQIDSLWQRAGNIVWGLGR